MVYLKCVLKECSCSISVPCFPLTSFTSQLLILIFFHRNRQYRPTGNPFHYTHSSSTSSCKIKLIWTMWPMWTERQIYLFFLQKVQNKHIPVLGFIAIFPSNASTVEHNLCSTWAEANDNGERLTVQKRAEQTDEHFRGQETCASDRQVTWRHHLHKDDIENASSTIQQRGRSVSDIFSKLN